MFYFCFLIYLHWLIKVDLHQNRLCLLRFCKITLKKLLWYFLYKKKLYNSQKINVKWLFYLRYEVFYSWRFILHKYILIVLRSLASRCGLSVDVISATVHSVVVSKSRLETMVLPLKWLTEWNVIQTLFISQVTGTPCYSER